MNDEKDEFPRLRVDRIDNVRISQETQYRVLEIDRPLKKQKSPAQSEAKE